MKTPIKAPKKAWTFSAIGANDYYADICRTLITQGTETAPKGKPTLELHPTTAFLTEPRQRLVSCYGRVINLPFALAEAIQIITGQNDAQALAYYNSGIIDIQGDGPEGTPYWQQEVTRFNAAYGERLRQFDMLNVKVDQLEHVIETLKLDPDSRQASIVLSHPLHDNYTMRTKDRACNVYAHPMIRDGALDWLQVIRSNDAVWGIPYNLVQWSHVQEWVAASLGIEMGSMFIVQDSFHVYADKFAECRRIALFDIYDYVDIPPMMDASDEIEVELDVAEKAIRAGKDIDYKTLSESVGVYWAGVLDCLRSFHAYKLGQDDKAFELLPEIAELKALMLRYYCHYRWSKLRTTFGDLLQVACLEVGALGIPHTEVEKWLGIERSLS